ncbi:isochorismatase family protein [Desulfurispira natronophila]|uniref:nicotinamidase n=1 Tax=Desulfurispira natronophila TaxID=682562 RepID=A0A7W7Y4Z9_9BACT|nr:isochorismatase family protein [Desulfurispira natronophila]MBB5021897.1 nicotinamidase/pyrazinamidase [Desulfurispira natronophila]
MSGLPAKSQIASFDIDAQYTFTPECPDELPVAGGTEIASQLNAQARFAAYRIGSKDAHSPRAHWVSTPEAPQFTPIDGSHVDMRWNVHAVPGTRGFELIAGLPHPSEYDYFVWKGVELDMHPYGACYHDLEDRLSTGVIEYLRQQGITTVIAGGLATDYCVRVTVLQLLQADFQVILNQAACRGIAPQSTDAALREMQERGALLVKSASDLPHLVTAP